MLHIRNFVKKYGNRTVLAIDSLDIGEGVTVLKGQNGSGKSSFFRSVSGIIPCSGNVHFADGTDLHSHPVKFREYISYSDAEPLFPGFLTARDLFHFVAKARRAPDEQVNLLVKNFGIESYFHNACETFSSGMMKKVGLALAFLGRPRIIILDEPLITLDEEARKLLANVIRTKLRENISFLLSSHQNLIEPDIPIDASLQIERGTIIKSNS